MTTTIASNLSFRPNLVPVLDDLNSVKAEQINDQGNPRFEKVRSFANVVQIRQLTSDLRIELKMISKSE